MGFAGGSMSTVGDDVMAVYEVRCWWLRSYLANRPCELTGTDRSAPALNRPGVPAWDV